MRQILDFVDSVAKCASLDQCWELLCEDLMVFGFDRILYGKKLDPDRSGVHNLTETVIYSTYGEDADEFFVAQRGYSRNNMVFWVLENVGSISWAVSRSRYTSGEMDADEQKIYEKMQDFGIQNGYTYANPFRINDAKSGFGLCFKEGYGQDHVDKVWAGSSSEIIARLQVFDVASSVYARFSKEETLTPRQVQILRLSGEGRSISEISLLVSVHRRTVENEMAEIRKVFGVATTLQAVLRAARQGQI